MNLSHFFLVLAFLGATAFQGRAQYCVEGRYGAEDTLFLQDDVRLEVDLEYGRAVDWLGDTVSLKLDVYYPDPALDTAALRPVILYLHGGGFHAGSKSNQKGREWAISFVRRGYVFVAADYRLGWPAVDSCAADTSLYMRAVYRATQDVRAAYRWMVEFSESWAMDTNQIVLLGTSAGSGAAMFATYSVEGDLGAYLSEELGPLDGSGNEYRHAFNPVAIVTKSAALDNLEVLSRRNIPHLMFHGTCDLTVPYTKGAIFHCYAPNKFIDVYGSGDIAAELNRLGRCNTLYKNIGQGHGAVSDDTVVVYMAEFMQSLFCETCETEFIERVSKTDVCADRSGKKSTLEFLFPNPSNGQFQVILSGPRDEMIPIELYNTAGQRLIQEYREFLAPVQRWSIDWSGFNTGVYFLKIGNNDRSTVKPLLIQPQAPAGL